MTIGDGNVFMIGCREYLPGVRNHLTPGVESPSIGNHNVFHPRSKASSLVHVTDNCNIGELASWR